MPYQAQPQSLFGSVGGPRPPTTQIDIPGAIEALSSGATSLIHQTMLRRQAQNQMTLEQQREAREASAQQNELAFRQKEATDRGVERNQDFQLRQQAERHRFLENGGIPEKTDVQPVEGTAPINTLQPLPTPQPATAVQRAMSQNAPGALPGVQVTPSAVPAAGPSTAAVYRPESVTTPESYDPTKSAAYIRSVETARARGIVQEEINGNNIASRERIAANRDATLTKMREMSTQSAKELVQLRAKLGTAKGAVAKQMTGNMLETSMEKAAQGLIAQTNGSYDDAEAFLNNTVEGKALRDAGLKPQHLLYARAQYVNGATNQAVRLQSGAAGLAPTKAVDAVRMTRNLVGGGAGGNTSTSPARATNFTDDELKAAMRAGNTTDASMTAWIMAQRKKQGASGGNR
jgi:hypothetical protein